MSKQESTSEEGDKCLRCDEYGVLHKSHQVLRKLVLGFENDGTRYAKDEKGSRVHSAMREGQIPANIIRSPREVEEIGSILHRADVSYSSTLGREVIASSRLRSITGSPHVICSQSTKHSTTIKLQADRYSCATRTTLWEAPRRETYEIIRQWFNVCTRTSLDVGHTKTPTLWLVRPYRRSCQRLRISRKRAIGRIYHLIIVFYLFVSAS